MTEESFDQLSKDLQALAKTIPLCWGAVQNDTTDAKVDFFNIHHYSELELALRNLDENGKNYFKRRWFLWKNAQCDEHLFCRNSNVKANPKCKDQEYDIEFNNEMALRFDVKGTVIPKCLRNNPEKAMADPQEMINFFYSQQSKGVRNHFQNRLFIVHHSFRENEREMYLRCHWDFKKIVYQDYCSKINLNSSFISYENVKADVIFILENVDKTFTYKFFAV